MQVVTTNDRPDAETEALPARCLPLSPLPASQVQANHPGTQPRCFPLTRVRLIQLRHLVEVHDGSIIVLQLEVRLRYKAGAAYV